MIARELKEPPPAPIVEPTEHVVKAKERAKPKVVAKEEPAASLRVEAKIPPKPKPKAEEQITKRYPLRWPLRGNITSRFGDERDSHHHDGIDIVVPLGTKVSAAADGEVLFSDKHGGYGNLVVLKHGNDFFTVYAHHEANLVKKGQKVSAGDVIARAGQTGRASTPHLHFEVRRGSRPENPLLYLPP